MKQIEKLKTEMNHQLTLKEAEKKQIKEMTEEKVKEFKEQINNLKNNILNLIFIKILLSVQIFDYFLVVTFFAFDQSE